MNGHVTQADTLRVVVALDTSETGRSMLDLSVRLASELGAELEGIYFENADLLQLAELPFMRELRPWSRAEASLSSQRVRKHLRSMARRAERMLEQAVLETGLSWKFTIWHGSTQSARLSAELQADVLGLACAGPSLQAQARYHAVSRKLKLRYPIQSVHVLFDESAQAARALTTAGRLAASLQLRLGIVLAATASSDREELKLLAAEVIKPYPVQVDYLVLNTSSIVALMRSIKYSGKTVLIAGKDHALVADDKLDRCLHSRDCPVMLVR